MHAFIDESCRGKSYLLTAVFLPPQQLQPVTRAIRDQVLRGQRRTHFSAEGHSRRKHLLSKYCELPLAASVAVAEYSGGDDQVARNACLVALTAAFTSRGVRVLTLDSRGEQRDKIDRRLLAKLQRDGTLPERLTYTHRGSQNELLLCLPDAFGWAYGAGGQWRRTVDPLVELVKVLR